MNVNICSINSQYIHASSATWCLLAGIKEYGQSSIKARVTEGTINEPITKNIERVLAHEPKVIGFCCYIWNIEYVLHLVDKIKQMHPKIIIVLGGPEVSYNAKEILQNKNIDFVCSGEGEKQFALLLNAIKNNTSFDIDGVCYKKDGKLILSEPRVETDTPPSPYCDEYFENLNGRISYIETSRGCPFSCAFCLSGKCGSVRFFDIEKAKKDLIKLSNSGTKTIKFVDRTFNANEKRAIEIINFIISNYGVTIKKDVCFHFEIAGDILSEEMIRILNSAPLGLFQLEIGMQSFNEQTLRSINRRTDTNKLRENITKLLAARNIHIHIDLIAGLPLEDLESFKKSFNIGFNLFPDMLQLGFLKLLHGSPMRENLEKYPCSFKENPPYEIIETPYITAKELKGLKLTETELDRLWNSGRFRHTVRYLLPFFESAYDMFTKVGEYMSGFKEQIPLDEYTDLCFAFFKNVKGVDSKVLRDKMLLDRLATNSSGVIPKSLKVEDKLLKEVKKMLENNPATSSKKGVRRSVALLYSENKGVYADYKAKNPVTGEYPLQFFDI